MNSYIPYYLSCFSVLLPLFFWLRKKPLRFKSRLLNSIGVLLVCAGLTDLIGYVLIKLKVSNIPVYNAYVIIEGVIISVIYSSLLKEKRRLVLGAAGIFIAYAIIITLFHQGVFTPQSWIWSVKAVLIISYGIAYFIAIIKDPPEENIFVYGAVWVNIAFMTYFIFSLVVFVMAHYIFTHLPPAEIRVLWNTHNFNNILKNIILAFGIYRIHRYVSAKYAFFKKFKLEESWWKSPL